MKFQFLKKWFKTKDGRSDFAKTFPKYPFYTADEKAFYLMLENLDQSTSLVDTQLLIDTLNSIPYSSNVSTYYEHFFPIVSHILYFKPEEEEKLLVHLVSPIFSMGHNKPSEIMKEIIGSKDFQLQKNLHFLTKEGMAWVENTLPNLLTSIQREVEKCWKELE